MGYLMGSFAWNSRKDRRVSMKCDKYHLYTEQRWLNSSLGLGYWVFPLLFVVYFLLRKFGPAFGIYVNAYLSSESHTLDYILLTLIIILFLSGLVALIMESMTVAVCGNCCGLMIVFGPWISWFQNRIIISRNMIKAIKAYRIFYSKLDVEPNGIEHIGITSWEESTNIVNMNGKDKFVLKICTDHETYLIECRNTIEVANSLNELFDLIEQDKPL
jgi:hypothetical protein